MKALIIEDEKAAVRNLLSLLQEVAPQVEVLTTLDSISESIEWFNTHAMPDIVFMDIHLADGSAFEIFKHTQISCPIIFTTAYDEYALQAFKVNSIDYLLKPIGSKEMEQAFKKLNILQPKPEQVSTSVATNDLLSLINAIKKEEGYRTHFLVPIKGDKLLPLAIESIHYFYIKGSLAKLMLADGTSYSIPFNLDELTESVNPTLFFRVNRQYLLSREAIKDISLWFNSRLSVNLVHEDDEEKIIVSKTRVAEFKKWFARK